MTSSARSTRIHLEKEAHKFSIAHMTVFADGSKERLHGHNYYVSLSVDLKPQRFDEFLDFNVVKRMVRELCEEWDERVILAERCPFFSRTGDRAGNESDLDFILCAKRYVLPIDEVVLLPIDNVTTEGLAGVLADRLETRFRGAGLESRVDGFEVGVTESHGQSGYVRVDFLADAPG